MHTSWKPCSNCHNGDNKAFLKNAMNKEIPQAGRGATQGRAVRSASAPPPPSCVGIWTLRFCPGAVNLQERWGGGNLTFTRSSEVTGNLTLVLSPSACCLTLTGALKLLSSNSFFEASRGEKSFNFPQGKGYQKTPRSFLKSIVCDIPAPYY